MSTKPTWTFKNQRDELIVTHNAIDAEKYRHHELFTEVTDTPTAAAGDDRGVVKPYAEWLKADLEAEIGARNDARGEGDSFIQVASNAKHAELAAALDTDDAAQAPSA